MPEQETGKETNGGGKRSFGFFTRSTLEVIGLVALALLLWQIVGLLLLVFLGLLLALIFSTLAGWLDAHLPLSYGGALAVSVLLVLALFGLGGWFMGGAVAQQASQLTQQLQQSTEQLRQYQWGQFLLQHASEIGSGGMRGGTGVLSGITGTATQAAGLLTDLVLVLFTGIYLAASADLYKRGLVRLLPKARRPRGRDVLEAVGDALRKWLLAQFISMALVGILTMLGLMLLGMPLALVLGLLAGLLEFVPFFGPFLAAVPAVLLAFTQGPSTALYVGLLYIGIQQVESNLIMPIVQKEEVSLPPVLTLTAAVGFGMLFGPLGVVIATPLAVVALVLVKMLYLEDTLGDSVSLPGR